QPSAPSPTPMKRDGPVLPVNAVPDVRRAPGDSQASLPSALLAEELSGEKCAMGFSRDELDAPLPRVCMCCGAPATTVRTKSFMRREVLPAFRGPVGMVIFVGEFAAAAAMRKHVLRAPFCDAHNNHWTRRTIWIVSILGMAGVFVVGLLALLALIIVS